MGESSSLYKQVLTPSWEDLRRFEQERKSAGTALFLCLIFGVFGAHRFYLHRPLAQTMLIITGVLLLLRFFGTDFGVIFLMWLWSLLDLASVYGWVKEHNAQLLQDIQYGVNGLPHFNESH